MQCKVAQRIPEYLRPSSNDGIYGTNLSHVLNSYEIRDNHHRHNDPAP
jgi:hypothetical protein